MFCVLCHELFTEVVHAGKNLYFGYTKIGNFLNIFLFHFPPPPPCLAAVCEVELGPNPLVAFVSGDDLSAVNRFVVNTEHPLTCNGYVPLFFVFVFYFQTSLSFSGAMCNVTHVTFFKVLGPLSKGHDHHDQRQTFDRA